MLYNIFNKFTKKNDEGKSYDTNTPSKFILSKQPVGTKISIDNEIIENGSVSNRNLMENKSPVITSEKKVIDDLNSCLIRAEANIIKYKDYHWFFQTPSKLYDFKYSKNLNSGWQICDNLTISSLEITLTTIDNPKLI